MALEGLNPEVVGVSQGNTNGSRSLNPELVGVSQDNTNGSRRPKS